MGHDAFEPLRYGIGVERTSEPVRWRTLRHGLAALGGLATVGGALSLSSGHVGLGIAATLAACMSAVSFWSSAGRSTARPQRELVLGAHGLWLETRDRPPVQLFEFGPAFGVSLLSNRMRDRLVVALSCGVQSLYIGAALDETERRTYMGHLSLANTVAEEEMVFDAIGSDSRPLSLRMSDLDSLLKELLRRDRRALDRCFLSGTVGEPVVLDGDHLRVGSMAFDLSAPLEWSASLFQESFGSLSGGNDWEPDAPPVGGVMVYQATWIRQGTSEVVLVSLLPSIAAMPVSLESFADQTRSLQAAVLRDLRLMQATPSAPPPRNLRVGIDRAYVIRLRAALDRAPRSSRKSEGSRRASAR